MRDLERTRAATAEEVRRSLAGHRRDVGSIGFRLLLLLSLIVALAALIMLLTQVALTAVPILLDRGGTIISSGYSSLPERAGISHGLSGSLYLMVFVVVLAFPLGIAAAIYMEEYARDSGLTRFINANIRNLAGVPAIVYGIFGLAVFVELLKPVTGPG
ncbi:MAG: hypothetical protein ACRELC_08250, partial [Gemmatimonadota bacterium]